MINRRKFLLFGGASFAAMLAPPLGFARGGVIVTPPISRLSYPEEIMPTARLICTGKVYLKQIMRGEEIMREIVTEVPHGKTTDQLNALDDMLESWEDIKARGEPDTSDIPECDAEWFKHARLQEPER